MSGESIKPPTTPNNSLTSKLKWIHNSKIAVEFKDICLKQEKVTFTYRNVVNVFIVCDLDTWSRHFNKKLSLIDCLFGDFKLTKNADPDKYGYLSCGIEVDASLQLLLPVG